jgi:hypothetical protein
MRINACQAAGGAGGPARCQAKAGNDRWQVMVACATLPQHARRSRSSSASPGRTRFVARILNRLLPPCHWAPPGGALCPASLAGRRSSLSGTPPHPPTPSFSKNYLRLRSEFTSHSRVEMQARGFAAICWWHEVPATYPGGAGGAVRHQAEPGDEWSARRREGGGLALDNPNALDPANTAG